MTRVFDHKVKRIFDHCTYNTETATEVAGFADKALFKTRAGTYFVAARWREMDEHPPEEHLGIKPLTGEQAKSWLGEYFPERELPSHDEPSEYRTTLRMPSDLKLRADALAKLRGQSLNAWIVRWLETGASADALDQKRTADLEKVT
jgi:hypothetical protein